VSVTGAGGFLGSYLLRELRTSWPEARIFAVGRVPSAELIDDLDQVEDVPESDIVFHLAGAAGIDRGMEDPLRDLRDNALGTLRLLEKIRRMPRVRLVLASSVAVYGRIDGIVSETQPPEPTSAYGVSKLAAEGYVRTYAHLHGVEGCVARIGNAYGPGQRKLAIYDLAWRALHEPPPLRLRGTGAEVRDFIHASDVARALTTIALRGVHGEAYNIGSGRGITLREVAELVARAAGLPEGDVRPDGVAAPGKAETFRPSVDKLARLGFRAAVAVERGIEETVAWMKSA
jgi:UDP-glucose 4-epimerase